MPPLLAWVCDEMERRPPKDTIEALAAADRGDDFDTNLAAIKQILAGDRRPLRPFSYPLREVFSLFRYHRPEPGQVLSNLISLFAVVVIAITERDPKNGAEAYLDEFEDAVIAIVELVTSVFRDRIADGLALFRELEAVSSGDDDGELLFLALGRFLLLEAQGAEASALLSSLADSTTRAERCDVDDDRAERRGRYHWLLSASGSLYDKDRWREGLDVALERLRKTTPEVADALEQLATRST